MVKKPVDISIVIVNHNTADFLSACLQSLVHTMPPSLGYEIIVVDNASREDPKPRISEVCPDCLLVRNRKNVGFSEANNQGVKLSSGRFVLFLNPDTVVREGTIGSMLRFLEETPEAGAATCFVELPDGRPDDAAHRGFPRPWNSLCHFSGISRLFPRSRLFSGYSLGWTGLHHSHEIEALAGCFMLVRHEAGNQVGWWDEDFFFYGEDLDFCYRLRRRNWKIYFVPHVSILHYKGTSSGIRSESRETTTADRATRIAATHARFQAMRIFYRKHYTRRYPRTVRWMVFAAIALKEWAALRGI